MENKKETNKKETKIAVDSIEIIVSVLDSEHPYYEIKYRKVGEKHHNIGFGSYCLENIIKWKEEMFDFVPKKREVKTEELAEKVNDAIDVIVPTLLALLTAEMERINDEDKNKENFVKLMAFMGLNENMNDFCKKYIYKENEKDKKDNPYFDIGILKILGGF